MAPAEFVDGIVAMKSMAEASCPWLEQMVVADLLADGDYDRHLRRLRKTYMERRDCLIQALKAAFGEVRLIGTESGTQLTWLLPERLQPADTVCEAARAEGVRIERVTCEAPCSYHDRALVLGYAGLSPEQLLEGISRLAAALRC